MLFCQTILKRSISICLLFFFYLPTIKTYAIPTDTTILKRIVIKEVSFPELKQISDSPDSSSFVIPFSRAGNLMIIKAKADST